MAERTYTEHEIQALLERAAQLQASSDDRPGPGLTLAELEQAAAEAGIDPAFLRAAAREAETGPLPRTVAGQTRTHVFVERTVPGTLADDEWEAVVLRLRRQFSSDLGDAFGLGPLYGPGVVETLGATRTWRHTTSMGVATTVTLRSTGEVQHLRLQRRVSMASPRLDGLILGALAALLPAFVAGGIAASGWAFLIVFLAAFALAAPAITALDGRWRKRKLDEISALADELAGLLRDEKEETAEVSDRKQDREASSVAGARSAEAPLDTAPLDLDALPDVDDVEPRRHKAPRTRSG